MKKTGRRKYAAYIIAGLLLAAVAAVLYRLYPAAKAAFILGKAPSFENFAYSAQVDLRRENLAQGQDAFVDALSWLLGVDGENLMSLKVTGEFCQDTLHAVVTCEGVEEPLTELWLSDNFGCMNAKQLYDTVRGRLTERYSLLNYMLPEWKYAPYISTEQIEEIFGVSLNHLYGLKDSLPGKKELLVKGLGMLVSMDGKAVSGGARFAKSLETADIKISVMDEGGIPRLSAEGVLKDESTIANGCRAEISFEDIQTLDMPDSLMEQDVVDQFASLWSVLTDLKNKIDELVS